MEKFLWEGILFATFVTICGTLGVFRFSRPARWGIGAAVLAGILALQGWLLLSGRDVTLVLTLLPLTAYLPAVAALHLLSRSGFFPTAAVWTVAAAACFGLTVLRKLLQLAGGGLEIPGWQLFLVETACLLLAASALVFLTFRRLRPFFQTDLLQKDARWLPLCFPAMAMTLLLSYFISSATNPTILILLLVTVLSVFAILARTLAASAEVARLQDQQLAVKRQLELQRQQCQSLRQQLQLGRTYRHDMRHHLLVLEGLARQDQAPEILAYVQQLGGQLSKTEERSYCRNLPINAVLSTYLGQAEQLGCRVTADIRLPKELPFDELDVCVLLANALENAVRACQALPGGQGCLNVRLELLDGQKLTVAVDNPCPERPDFDGEGLPLSRRPGHGLGLRSARAVAEKYHGLIQCRWERETFQFRAALFLWHDAPPAPGQQPRPSAALRRGTAAAAFGLLALFLMVNCLPQLADSLENTPVLGAAARLIDARTYGWGDTAFSEDLSSGAEEADPLAQQREDFLSQMEEAFWWYAARRYNGYVGMDVSQEVLRDDAAYFSVRFDGVLNAGGSGQYSRCFTLDKASGRILSLADLFQEGADYVGVISQEILRQMTAAAEAGQADYFVPGGIWSEEECFQRIDPDQNFYLDAAGELVILFEEYEVAPGSMGTPAFQIPRQVLEPILLRPAGGSSAA